MSFSDKIAFLSLIISIFVAIWTIYKDLKDRGHLKVNMMFGDIIGNQYEKKDIFAINMTNVGKRDIVIKAIAGYEFNHPLSIQNVIWFYINRFLSCTFQKENGFFILLDSHNNYKRLKEGDVAHQEMNLSENNKINSICQLFVIDTSDKKYHVSTKNLFNTIQAFNKNQTNKNES